MLKKIERILVALGYGNCEINNVKVEELGDEISITFSAKKSEKNTASGLLPKHLIEAALRDGYSCEEAAKEFGVSEPSVRLIYKKMVHDGEIEMTRDKISTEVIPEKKTTIEEVRESTTASIMKAAAKPKTETLGNYISRLEKEQKEKAGKREETRTDVKPVSRSVKSDKTDYKKSSGRYSWKTPVPRAVARWIYFKTFKDAESFVDTYSSDFELVGEQRKCKNPTSYKLTKNKDQKELLEKGYGYVVEFHMNGAAFEVLENVEKLKKRENGYRGSNCIRYKE